MPSDTTIYNNSQVFIDSLRTAPADSVWIANIPQSSWFESPVVSVAVNVIFILLAAWVGHRWTRRMYEHQEREARLATSTTAFNLFWAICDEMRRTRERVEHILRMESSGIRMKEPILTGAKDELVGRLAELMPAWWDPHHVFRFYELLGLVTAYHNATVATASVPVTTAWMLLARFGDRSTINETNRVDSIYRSGVFACSIHFDGEHGDSLTSHYIEAVKQLDRLRSEVRQDETRTLPIPSDADRAQMRELVVALRKR